MVPWLLLSITIDDLFMLSQPLLHVDSVCYVHYLLPFLLLVYSLDCDVDLAARSHPWSRIDIKSSTDWMTLTRTMSTTSMTNCLREQMSEWLVYSDLVHHRPPFTNECESVTDLPLVYQLVTIHEQLERNLESRV